MLRNFNMVCILSDVNKIDPNLTFRSSRTPSVCQYKHQSLVGSYFTNQSKTITHHDQAEIFQGKLSTIVIFIPCKLCENL